MARIRTIKPEFWADEEIGELSTNARLLFIATWNMADDEGLLNWSAPYLKAQVFAYDDFTRDDVQGFMDELSERGMVVPYKDAKGKMYGWILNFRKHQKIDKPQSAKHPLPSLQNAEIRRRYADRDEWSCHICGDPIEATTNDNAKVLSVDHVKAKSNGGTDAPSNIRVAHFGCNSGKKDRTVQEDSENVPRNIPEGSTTEGKGREGKKERKGRGEPCRAEPDGAVDRVFDHWKTTHGHPKAVLDPKRRKLIRDRLKDYSEADLCEAVTGYLNSPHHMGDNDRDTKYDAIELMLRDAKHVDMGIKFQREPPRTHLSAKSRRIADATEDWKPPEMRRAAN